MSEDLLIPEQETLVHHQERLQGNHLYSYNSLIHDIPKIDVLRENTIYHRSQFIEIHEDQIYSMDIGKRISGATFTTQDFSRLFGRKAKDVFQILAREGYVETVKGKIRIRSKFRICGLEDFRLNGAEAWEVPVFTALQSLLVQRIPVNEDSLEENEILKLLFSRKNIRVPQMRNSSINYLFRMGNNLISIDFCQPPSPELLELIRLRLELVFEENMVNFFQIASSFSADEAIWRQNKKKNDIFSEILVSLLGICWKLFDLEECCIRISGGTDMYSFCNTSLKYKVDPEGKSSFVNGKASDFPRTLNDQQREYMIKGTQILINMDNFEPILMDLYMKSRSLHNVNPRRNHLHHKFILMLIEKIAKTIEQVMPVLKAEEMKNQLKWKGFLDRSRLRAMSWGEDLFRIMVDSVGILQTFLGLPNVSFFTPDQEFCKMLNIYESDHPKIGRNFQMLEHFPSEEEMNERGLIPIRLLEAINEELFLFVSLPMNETIRLEKGKYLSGNALVDYMLKIARGLGLNLTRDEIIPLMMNSLNSNSMLTMSKMVEKWPRASETMETGTLNSHITQFASRFIAQLSHFFDVIQSMDNNIEAGIANMRGSRDRLTGVFNRQKFNQKLEVVYNQHQHLGLMFIDMDTFKIYNDSISHSFGDLLLIGLSERILQACRLFDGNAYSARFGGDEFCFALSGLGFHPFEEAACRVFHSVVDEPEKIILYYEERDRKKNWEINAISFFHRLLRPDVGGIRGAATEFVEPHHESPFERIMDVYDYYRTHLEGEVLKAYDRSSLSDEDKECITQSLVKIIIEKIERNKMFSDLNDLFRETVTIFIREQLNDLNTQDIRTHFMNHLNGREVIVDMYYKISAGLAHSDEDRLRSISTLFKAADSRAYIAKHNGRNGLFGLENQRLI